MTPLCGTMKHAMGGSLWLLVVSRSRSLACHERRRARAELTHERKRC